MTFERPTCPHEQTEWLVCGPNDDPYRATLCLDCNTVLERRRARLRPAPTTSTSNTRRTQYPRTSEDRTEAEAS